MILYCISGVVPYKQIKFISLDKIEDSILNQIKKTHSGCLHLDNPEMAKDIQLIFENDGVYYNLNIEA